MNTILSLISFALKAEGATHPILLQIATGLDAIEASGKTADPDLGKRLLPIVQKYVPAGGVLADAVNVAILFAPYVETEIGALVANSRPALPDSGVAETLPSDAPAGE